MLKNFAIAWTLMWGLSYIVVAMIAPDISDLPGIVYIVTGELIIMGVTMKVCDIHARGFTNIFLGCLGGLMIYGGIASWTGVAIWNVPFENLELFQVSMAFADLLSATFMFVLALER